MLIFQRFLSLVLVLFLGLASASGQDKKLPGVPVIDSYYPLRPGIQWHYKATSGTAEAQKVKIVVDQQEEYTYRGSDDKKENRVTFMRTRLKITSGTKELTEHVAVLADSVYRFTSAGKEITPPLRFFKFPLVKGEKWECQSTSENMVLKGTFSCDDDVVTVPFGKFAAKWVFCPDFQIGNQKMAVDYWFAQDIGMVKQRVRVGTFEVVLELEKFEGGK